jgi:multidrug efflux pump subunit AcrA (membrane-fusion protein)
LTGPQAKLYAGTSATVSIITRQVSNVIAVPTLALHTSGSTTYVEKQTGGQRVRTTVKVGQTYGANTQITSGLKSGDIVVITSVRLPTGTRTGTNGNRFPGGGGFGGGFGGGTGPPAGGFGNGGGAP